MIKAIVTVVGMLAVVLLGLVAMQPSQYRVVRKATIGAPVDVVFAKINDFHEWDSWSPWAKLDPQMKASYSGAPAGKGAVYGWTGNDEVGEGKMTILESKPGEWVKIDLQFVKPFESRSVTEFRLRRVGAGSTEVEWAMSGESGFVEKAFRLAMGGMDRMIGPDFEKGLGQMKGAVEK